LLFTDVDSSSELVKRLRSSTARCWLRIAIAVRAWELAERDDG
jgi:hypothetical protein